MKSFGVRSMGGRSAARSSEFRVPGSRLGTRNLELGTLSSDLGPRTSDLFVRYSHIPSLPPSRPYPLSRYPPNPADASNRFVELIQTTPASSFGATSSARLMFSVHTLAAKP